LSAALLRNVPTEKSISTPRAAGRPRSQPEGHRVVRSGGDDGDREHRPPIGERELEVLDEDREHKRGLRERELGADAHPRTGAERQKGKAMGRLAAEKARRNEGVRIVPQPDMQSAVTRSSPGRDGLVVTTISG